MSALCIHCFLLCCCHFYAWALALCCFVVDLPLPHQSALRLKKAVLRIGQVEICVQVQLDCISATNEKVFRLRGRSSVPLVLHTSAPVEARTLGLSLSKSSSLGGLFFVSCVCLRSMGSC